MASMSRARASASAIGRPSGMRPVAQSVSTSRSSAQATCRPATTRSSLPGARASSDPGSSVVASDQLPMPGSPSCPVPRAAAARRENQSSGSASVSSSTARGGPAAPASRAAAARFAKAPSKKGSRGWQSWMWTWASATTSSGRCATLAKSPPTTDSSRPRDRGSSALAIRRSWAGAPAHAADTSAAAARSGARSSRRSGRGRWPARRA